MIQLSKFRTLTGTAVTAICLVAISAFPHQGSRELFEWVRRLDESYQVSPPTCLLLWQKGAMLLQGDEIMGQQAITVKLSEEIHERVKRTGQG